MVRPFLGRQEKHRIREVLIGKHPKTSVVGKLLTWVPTGYAVWVARWGLLGVEGHTTHIKAIQSLMGTMALYSLYALRSEL